MPEAEALRTIRRLRSIENASMVLSSIEGSVHTANRPSNLAASRGTFSSTQSNIEFELSMLHHLVYPALQPLDVQNLIPKDFFQPGPPESQLPFTTHINSLCGPVIPTEKPVSIATTCNDDATSVQVPQYCDPRLNRLTVGYWTRVPISNELAACAISHYLELYHAILGSFDADLFLADLLDQKLNFCSPFLFSALMSLACVCFLPFCSGNIKYS